MLEKSSGALRDVLAGDPQMAVVRGDALNDLPRNVRSNLCVVAEILASARPNQTFLLVGAKSRPEGRRLALSSVTTPAGGREFLAGLGEKSQVPTSLSLNVRGSA